MLFCSRGLHRRLARYGRCSSRRRARERPSANHRHRTDEQLHDCERRHRRAWRSEVAAADQRRDGDQRYDHRTRHRPCPSSASPAFGRIFPGGGRDLVRLYRGDDATHGLTLEAASRNGVVGAVGRTRSNGIRGTRASATRRIRYASSPGPHCRRHHAQRDASGPQPRFPRGVARRLGSAERPAHSHDPAIRERDRPGRRSDGCSPCGNVIWGALNDFENEPFPWWYDVWAVDFNKIVSGVRGRAPRPAQQRTTGGPGGPVTPASIPSPTPQQGASQ